MLSIRLLNVSSRQALVGNKLRLWLDLGTKVLNVELNDQNDGSVWNLTKHTLFTVKSTYTYFDDG